MAKSKPTSPGLWFPFDRRIGGEIKSPSFSESFPNASEDKIKKLFSDYYIDEDNIDLFKEFMAFSTITLKPTLKTKLAEEVAEAANKLLSIYNDQNALEVLYENVTNRRDAGKYHESLIVHIRILISLTEEITTRYKGKRAKKEGTYVNLYCGVQSFLLEIGLPYNKRSQTSNEFNTNDFSLEAVKAITGLSDLPDPDYAIRKGITKIDVLDRVITDLNIADSEEVMT